MIFSKLLLKLYNNVYNSFTIKKLAIIKNSNFITLGKMQNILKNRKPKNASYKKIKRN